MAQLQQAGNFIAVIINPQTWISAGVGLLLILLIILWSIDRVVDAAKDVKKEVGISNAVLRTIETHLSQIDLNSQTSAKSDLSKRAESKE